MTNNISQVTRLVNDLIRIDVKAPLTCPGSIALAIALCARLSLIMLAAVAIVGGPIVISMKKSYVRFAKVQKTIDPVNTVVQENLMGVRLVKAFGRQSSEEQKFEVASETLA